MDLSWTRDPAASPPARGARRLAALCLGGAAALAAGFAVLAGAVLRRSGSVDAFDAAVAGTLDRLPDFAVDAALLVGRLGDPVPATLAAAGVAVAFAVLRRRLDAIAWVAALAGNGAWTWALKRLVARARPLDDGTGMALSATYSFPSAHSAGVLVACGLLAYLVARHRSAGVRVAAALAACAVVAATGASRVLADHHHASDVLASVLSGGAWLMVGIAAVAWAGRSAADRAGAALASREPRGVLRPAERP